MGTQGQVVTCDLAQLAACRRLSAAELAGVGRDVARALAEAHERGVVHRHLSAQHVVFEADGRAQVVGFGWPIPDDALVPGVVAPEVTGDGWSTSAADVFALGALLEGVGARGDRDLARLVRACTARDMTQRPSADELAERFERIAQDRVRGGATSRGWRYAVAGFGCFVVGGLLAAATLWPEPEPKRLEHLQIELPRVLTQLEMAPSDQGTTRTAAAER